MKDIYVYFTGKSMSMALTTNKAIFKAEREGWRRTESSVFYKDNIIRALNKLDPTGGVVYFLVKKLESSKED